jgi:hypothetical protein
MGDPTGSGVGVVVTAPDGVGVAGVEGAGDDNVGVGEVVGEVVAE